ncbi:hypothetical protein L1987_05894 [Smallanthus sonchifolius]|uniref:Uncharacterized protein n=1 Tax=Smallanthus sonchifolius TaxID=185202 RepID=A0ACB9JWT5_9ASTR|nr:hypothetical protein L1987_05894 [Smallanthus sonchifolius]
MATAAFKSNSKRSDGYGGRDSSKTNPNPNPQKPKLRRSLSVNALSRSTQLDIPTEFLNKRDNPLYWATGGSPTADNNTETPAPIAAGSGALESNNSDVRVGQRGRSVNRSSDLRNGGQKGEISGRRRSLSRVNDNGSGNGRRGRSVSRAKLGYGASESEAEQESRIPITHGGRGRASSSTGKLPVSGVKSFERSSRPSVGSSFDSQVSNCEDGISTSSLSEAEEKTIKAVYEQMKSFEVDSLRKDTASNEIYETVRSEVRRAIADIQDDLHDAIRRNSSGALVSTDTSPKLVKPGAVELVLDIRREYAKELEASQERARKLRSDLAIEEHHRQELSRILKETLPEPKTSSSHRSRLGRKSSSERRKMSKRLTDEAMSYFDECVSISTFDSSDFSAAEDPSVNSLTPGSNYCIDQQMVHGDPVSSSVVDSSCNELVMDRVETTNSSERDRKFLFSFGHKQTESIKLQHDIESYIKSFEKDKTIDGTRRKYNYNTYVYELLDVNESLLFDTVFFRNRQESGSLHICGAAAVPFLPFPHLF